jgi:hypothetical protein
VLEVEMELVIAQVQVAEVTGRCILIGRIVIFRIILGILMRAAMGKIKIIYLLLLDRIIRFVSLVVVGGQMIMLIVIMSMLIGCRGRYQKY